MIPRGTTCDYTFDPDPQTRFFYCYRNNRVYKEYYGKDETTLYELQWGKDLKKR